MATPNFQLQPAIDGFIERLKSKGGLGSEDLDELKFHLVDSVSDLRLKGLSTEEAFLIASCRIGNENELAAEYQKVNGSITSRPRLFFLITGMLLFFLLYQVWALFRSLSLFIALRLDSSPEGGFFISLFFSLLLIGTYFCILNASKSIANMERKFFRKQDNFSIIYVAGGLLLSLAIIYLNSLLASSIYSLLRSNPGYEIDSSYSEINFWIVPAGFLALTLFFLFKGENEKFSFGKLVNRSGLLFFISMGIIWEVIAAYTRFITRGMNMLTSALIYSMVFSVAIFILSRYIEHKVIPKLFAFAAFAFIVEIGGGLVNPLLTMGTWLSVFFYSLICVGTIAFLAGRLFKKKYQIA